MATSPDSAAPAPAVSAWAPLRQPAFRALWIASVASNVGTWMHEVGAGWLMTSLAPSPVMVSLVQAATSLPMFLLALPAGVLADLVDRRRLLLVTQLWMTAAALVLGLLVHQGLATPWLLLGITFALGVGASLNAPPWQAIVPELVPPADLAPAVALNSMGFNIARAAGPALGGLVIAALGPAANFLFNGVSFFGVVLVLYFWRRPAAESALPAESFLGALRSGGRYIRHSPRMRAVMVRGALFVLCGSALWALLPLVARFRLESGPGGYGALLGSFGIGAVAGATQLPRLRARFPTDRLALAGTIGFALALVGLAWAPDVAVAAIALALGGGAWLTVLSGFNVAAQTSVPAWVRARALSYYLLVFYAGLALGSSLWGAIAHALGTPAALSLAAAGMFAGLVAIPRYPVRGGKGVNLAPSRHWPAPLIAAQPEADRGPVLVTIEYRIDPVRAEEFAAAMRVLRRSRRRGGAVRWNLWTDAADPARYVESFSDESWLDYLRHHERLTAEDREIEGRARAFHVGEEPPRVRLYLADPYLE